MYFTGFELRKVKAFHILWLSSKNNFTNDLIANQLLTGIYIWKSRLNQYKLLLVVGETWRNILFVIRNILSVTRGS